MGTQILCHDFQWKIRNLFSEQQTVDTNFTVYDAGQLPVSLEEGREGWGRDDVYRRNNNTTLLISTVHDGAKNILLRSGEKLVI